MAVPGCRCLAEGRLLPGASPGLAAARERSKPWQSPTRASGNAPASAAARSCRCSSLQMVRQSATDASSTPAIVCFSLSSAGWIL